MDKKISTFIAALILIVVLAACQTANAATLNNQASNSTGNSPANGQALTTQVVQTAVAAAISQTQSVSATSVQTQTTTETQSTAIVTATATADSKIASAIEVAKTYFNDLANKDFSDASQLISAQSLRISGITAGDASDELQKESKNGTSWSDLTVSGGEVFDSSTILVKVTYQLTSTDATTQKSTTKEVDELWAMRLEGGKWFFNWENIIDMESVDASSQENSGLTLTPFEMVRYTDKIVLHMIARNVSGSSIYMGDSTQILGTFYFGSDTTNAVNNLTVLQNTHTDTDYTISVAGLFTSYPTKVEILKYKDYPTVAPWFTFSLSS